MSQEKIKELFSDEEYVKGLFELESYEKASEKLAEDGVKVSPEELKKVLELAKKQANGELGDDDLENVSGGIIGAGALIGLLSALIVGGSGLLGGTIAISERC